MTNMQWQSLTSYSKVFAIPATLAVLTLSGLVVALFGDGILDVAAWFALGLSVAVVFWAMFKARRTSVSTGL